MKTLSKVVNFRNRKICAYCVHIRFNLKTIGRHIASRIQETIHVA